MRVRAPLYVSECGMHGMCGAPQWRMFCSSHLVTIQQARYCTLTDILNGIHQIENGLRDADSSSCIQQALEWSSVTA